jgi:hypothetical protein
MISYFWNSIIGTAEHTPLRAVTSRAPSPAAAWDFLKAGSRIM